MSTTTMADWVAEREAATAERSQLEARARDMTRPATLATAGAYVEREWGGGGYRYRMAHVASHQTWAVFLVRASDGGTFLVLADEYGNAMHCEQTETVDDRMARAAVETAARWAAIERM